MEFNLCNYDGEVVEEFSGVLINCTTEKMCFKIISSELINSKLICFKFDKYIEKNKQWFKRFYTEIKDVEYYLFVD